MPLAKRSSLFFTAAGGFGKTELLAHFCEGKTLDFFRLRSGFRNIAQDLSVRCGQYDFIWFQPDERSVFYLEDLFHALPRRRRASGWWSFWTNSLSGGCAPPLATILQRVWDQTLKNSQIMLILCGSYIGMMEETVLGYQAPLIRQKDGTVSS